MTTRIFAWSKSLNFQFFPSTPGRSKFGAFAPIFNVATSGSSDTPATAVMERARSAAKTVLEIIVPPAENQFVVPPLGGSVECSPIPRRQTLPPKGGTTNCDFHSFRASQRDMKALRKSFALLRRRRQITSRQDNCGRLGLAPPRAGCHP